LEKKRKVDKDRMKCICCGEKKPILFSVTTEFDSLFSHYSGVCQDCIKSKDVLKIRIDTELQKARELLEDSKESVRLWEEKVKEFEKFKNGEVV
jgi:hypothetical protein